MGVPDAGMFAMRGHMDWNSAHGTIDHIRELVGQANIPAEFHTGDGLFSGPHFCDPKADLADKLDRAEEHLERARQLCYAVLEAL